MTLTSLHSDWAGLPVCRSPASGLGWLFMLSSVLVALHEGGVLYWKKLPFVICFPSFPFQLDVGSYSGITGI